MATLSSTVRCGNRPALLDDVADAAAQLVGRHRDTSLPSIVIVPVVGSMSRLIIRRVVVLPEPELPTSATTSPASTVSERSSTAIVRSPLVPNSLVT